MKTLLTFLLLFAASMGLAQTIQYRNLNSTQLSSNNFRVSIIAGVRLTNPVVGGTIIGDGSGLTNVTGGVGVSGAGGITSVTNGNVVTLSLYVAPTITSFINNRNNTEIGTTIMSTLLDWTLGGAAITSQSLNQSIGALAIGDRTYTHTLHATSVYTTSRTYTLTVSDGTSTVQANSAVTFMNKAYWGVSTNTSLTDAQIRALAGQELTLVRQREVLLSPAQQYVYFAWPANSSAGESFGPGTFTVGGLDFTAITPTTRAFLNATLVHSEDYIIYRSDNLLDSTFTFAVQ